MKRSCVLLCVGLVLPLVWAQAADPLAVERARIQSERAQAQDRLQQEEKACYARFAVSSCLEEARSRHRETMAQLRRQEVSLNDAQRKRLGVAKQREIQERQAARQHESAQQPPQARQGQAESEARTDENAKIAQPQGKPRSLVKTQPATPRPDDPQLNARRHEAKVVEAQQHKQRVLERQAKKKKQAQPLAVPAAP